MNTAAVHLSSAESNNWYAPPSVKVDNGFQRISFDDCSHFWSYVGKINIIGRNLLNASAKMPLLLSYAGTEFPKKVKNIVLQMKVLSIVSVPFSLVDLKSVVQKIFKAISVRDYEGIALAALSFTIITTDAFDSLTTFVNSILGIIGKVPVGIFAALGIPLAFVMSVGGTISRTIQIVKVMSIYQFTHQDRHLDIQFKSKESIRNSLVESLGIAEIEKNIKKLSSSHMDEGTRKKVQDLGEKKKAIISRLIPKEAITSVEKLLNILSMNGDLQPLGYEHEIILQSLQHIRSHLKIKIKVNVMAIVGNLVNIAALILFAAGVTTGWPLLILAVAFIIKLLAVAYQDYKLKQLKS